MINSKDEPWSLPSALGVGRNSEDKNRSWEVSKEPLRE